MRFSILTISFLLCVVTSFAQNAGRDEISMFVAKTGAIPTIDKATNSLSFLKFPTGKALKIRGVTASEKALSFVRSNARLFAMQSDKDSYQAKNTKKDNYGLEHVVLQQYFRGVAVFDGVLNFHFNRNSDLSVLNGNYIPVNKLNTVPSISKEEAAREAIRQVTGQKWGKFKAELKIRNETLYVFQKGLAQGYQGEKHLVYEVEVGNNADVREFLYIDAHTRELVEQFTGMHHMNRTLYEEEIAPENKIWEEGMPLPGTLDLWQQSEVESSGHLYNLMKNAFGYVSYDNNDSEMITVNNSLNIDCPDANWNGTTANFCTGTAADDIVAHEWAHAYTEYTSGLLNAWQPGAINESYSDIWGETVDLLNGFMDQGEITVLRTGCGNSTRWEVGEKSFEFNSTGKDMWDPNCKSAPGKISDPLYGCSSADDGSVHTNSSVLNHAYALLVDGGTYNGQTITGIGLTKAAHIFWHAQAGYMTKTTDFRSQADMLEASLADLIGINLQGLSTASTPAGLSGEIITSEDAAQLAKVIEAVELRAENKCNFLPILKPLAAICSGASPDNAVFHENFESGMGGWSVSNTGSTGTWIARDWVLDATAPGGRPGHVAYGVDYTGGDCGNDLQNGVITLVSPEITVPTESTGPFYMAFDHYVAIEAPYDGGNIKFRINNGEWTLVPQSAFTANGYNKNISSTNQDMVNPLQGEPTFSGVDEGSTVSTWGQSRIDLSSLGLSAGQTVQFRWDLGTDGCVGLDGWYIDDVRVYSCALPSVLFVTEASSVNEGEAINTGPAPNDCLKYVERTITVKINKAPSAPVTVKFKTPSGTAAPGTTADYSIMPESFVLQDGALSQDVTVRIYNDSYVEGNETVTLAYTLSTNGDAYAESYNQEHTITIVDDDILPGSVNTELVSEDFNLYVLPSDWWVIGEESYPDSWGIVQNPDVSLDPGGSPLLMINSYAAGEVNMDKSVETGTFNTVGMTDINVSFIEFFYVYPSGFLEQGMVDVWDGSAWHNLLTQSEETGTSGSWDEPALRNITIPQQYANSAMKIRFRYIANNDYWWAIDNVKITGNTVTQIESEVTATPEPQYLGPHATAYFYDPATKGLIAKIRNLSDHDYGCTSVVIDRAGQNETRWLGSYNITNKTFKVTPANNNATGNYEITLYYKASELPDFNGADIKSMAKSQGGIGPANRSATSETQAVSGTAIGLDYAYTASFFSGFSGFGLSDALPSGALPVTLVQFEGKHTFEGNLVSWTTTSETNNEYFAIERSINGRDFIQVGRVDGRGNSRLQNQYRFIDTNHAIGIISYYRLKQVDSDGTFGYSRIISLDASNTAELKFFPNPVHSVLVMELPDTEIRSVDIKVINAAGIQVLNLEKVGNSNGRVNLDLGNLPQGIYQVVLLSRKKQIYKLAVFKQ